MGGGVQLFPGGGGVQLLIPYRNPITCDFPGGSGPTDHPLDPHLLSRPAGDSFFPFSRRWVVFFSFILILIDHDSVSKQWRSGDSTCGSRGGLVGPETPPLGKSQVIWVSLDTPTPWKKLDPLLPSVIKPLDPLCKL